MTVPTNNEEAEALELEEARRENLMQGICDYLGDLGYELDSHEETTEFLLDLVSPYAAHRASVSGDNDRTEALDATRDRLQGLGYSSEEVILMLIGFDAGFRTASQPREVEVTDDMRAALAELNDEIAVETGEARAEERQPSAIVGVLGRARDALEVALGGRKTHSINLLRDLGYDESSPDVVAARARAALGGGE